jgi:hypothetical protein
MFKWLEEINEPPFQVKRNDGELKIKRLETTTVELNEMSPVFQFFASYDLILGQDSLTSLPTPNESALETILNEVVPHYSNVKQIFIDGKLKEINVMNLKESSKIMLKGLLLSNKIFPVIPDLYRTKKLNWTTKPRKLKYYLVRQDLIKPVHNKEAEQLGDFLKDSYFAESGSIMLSPTRWKVYLEIKIY